MLVVDAHDSHVGVVREIGRFFKRPSGFEESRNAGCSSDMVSNPFGYSGPRLLFLASGIGFLKCAQTMRGVTSLPHQG